MTERNPAKTKYRRQELRRLSTKAEIVFWDAVRSKKLGFKVRRQYGIGPYILDFYLPQSQIAIEIDGDIHIKKEVSDRDRNKDVYLQENGIRVLRFTNESVINSLEIVINEIKEAVYSKTPSVFPFKKGRTSWMDKNYIESPPLPTSRDGGDSGGHK